MATVTSIHAAGIRAAIRHAEAEYDRAQAALADLKMKMLAARAHPDVGPGETQELFVRLGAVEQRMLASSTDLLRIHKGLNQQFKIHSGPGEPNQETWPIALGDEATEATDTSVPALVG